jgi:hypothetical protein
MCQAVALRSPSERSLFSKGNREFIRGLEACIRPQVGICMTPLAFPYTAANRHLNILDNVVHSMQHTR